MDSVIYDLLLQVELHWNGFFHGLPVEQSIMVLTNNPEAAGS